MDMLIRVMEGFGKLLGLSDRDARTLARAIAGGPDRPINERDALARMRRAALAQGSEDDADRAVLATWLAAKDADRGLDRLPMAGPASGGLPMPAQDLDGTLLSGLAHALGVGVRERTGRALRSDT